MRVKRTVTLIQLSNALSKDLNYEVVELKNDTRPAIGERITEDGVERLIKDGYEVKIKGRKK